MNKRTIKQEAIYTIGTNPSMVQDTFSWLIQPKKIKPYYTDARDAVKFIGFPMYVVGSNDEIYYCQSDAIARKFIAELKDSGKMYVYLLYKSPNNKERIDCWLPPPAQK